MRLILYQSIAIGEDHEVSSCTAELVLQQLEMCNRTSCSFFRMTVVMSLVEWKKL